MAEQASRSEIDLYQVVRIVGSYVRHHQVAADQLAALIIDVHRALAGLGRPPPAQQRSQPAVPIRRSVQQDHIICLECGFRGKTLGRHLRLRHGLDVAVYRARWKIAAGSPGHGTGLFRASLGDGKAAWLWPSTRRGRTPAPANTAAPAFATAD